MAVTRERNKPAWGHWVKVLNRARRDYGTERTDRLFRECVTELYGEMKAGEVRKPGAIRGQRLVFLPSVLELLDRLAEKETAQPKAG